MYIGNFIRVTGSDQMCDSLLAVTKQMTRPSILQFNFHRGTK